MKEMLLSLITENDGRSICLIRLFAVLLTIPTLLFFVIGITTQLIHGHFDLQGMSTAFATLCGGFASLGVSVALKMKNETQ
jgi:hypothetical protein